MGLPVGLCFRFSLSAAVFRDSCYRQSLLVVLHSMSLYSLYVNTGECGQKKKKKKKKKDYRGLKMGFFRLNEFREWHPCNRAICQLMPSGCHVNDRRTILPSGYILFYLHLLILSTFFFAARNVTVGRNSILDRHIPPRIFDIIKIYINYGG